ncbi:hypothetical protein C8R42DRAFT_672202 [Lentinula raphanica]|nr:hypothetical protein C8R42DRAFT_672202 [Lentinula raphanica]
MGTLRTSIVNTDTLSRNIHVDGRGEPKIGGSVGGFIALVVCLILVIIIASTATFLLLRQEIHDEATATRRRRRHQHQAAPPSSYVYDPSSTPSKSWLASVKARFSSSVGSISYSAARKIKSHDGWVQAGSGDEWDDDMRDVEQLRHLGPSDSQYATAYSPPLDPPFRPPGNLTPESASTIQPHTSYITDSRIPNRFMSEPSPFPSSILRSYEMPIIPRSASPEAVSPSPRSPSHAIFESQNRKDSTNSDISTRTFSSGTKFVEGL